MACSHPAFGQQAEMACRVETQIAFARPEARHWVEEKLAILGHEEKDQPVHDSQQLPVVVLLVYLAAPERLPQIPVRRMHKEASTERGDRFLDAGSQLIERPRPLLLRRLRPS